MTMNRYPLSEGYQRIRAAVAELRHQVGQLQAALAQGEDHFAAAFEQALQDARRPKPVTFSKN